jgi:tetratricopeptide (TPR) repeat protein
MIEEAHDSGIPIIFTAPVSSLRDQKPFQSLANPTATLEERRSWKMAQVTGDSLYGLGQHAESVPWYRKSLTHDSLYAGTWYRLGQALYQSGRYDEARAAFVSARDHDALRFRMSEEFASALREVCGSHHVPLARVDSVFMDSSPHGIIGHELILEHLHPNIEGYALMARTWTHTIATQGLLADKSEWRWNNEVDNEEYMRRAGVTRFDWTVGRIRVEYLRHRWPFEAARTAYEFTPTTEVDSIAQQYVGKKIWWQEARYALAARYIKRRDFEAARMEVLAVAKVIPFSFWPRLRFADCYLMEGKKEEAMKAYLDCIAIEDNPYARSKLALILIERSDFPEAITQLQSAFQLDATTNHKLPTDVAASNRYLLGYAYAQTQNMKEAKDQLHRALAINPNLLDAKELLERIE